jgi:hypothetical protein
MKDSGIEWLGEVSAHWIIGAVKHFVTVLDSRRIPLSSEERSYKNGDFPYYGGTVRIPLFCADWMIRRSSWSRLINPITLLQERHTALISAAVTGKIDVRSLVSTKPEVKTETVPC